MDSRIKKQLLVVTAVTFVASMCGPALALNGNTRVISCACQTTTDFINAAKSDNLQQQQNLTYTAISYSTSTTAYIRVTGRYKGSTEPIWVVGAATPVDANGNSLSGNTEAQNQTYFAALDETIFGANRTLVAANKQPPTVNLSPDYEGSIINSDDAEIGPGIDSALSAKGILWSDLPSGTVVTVIFEDGTKAQFMKVGQMTDHWVWNGQAWNKQGQRIDRQGNVLQNQNTSGSASGTANFTYGQVQYNFVWQALCTWEQTITIDGNGDSDVLFEGPC